MLPILKQLTFAGITATGYYARRRKATRSCLRIVTWHGVDEQTHPVLNADRLQVHPQVFTGQLAALARAFRIVPLHEAVRGFLADGVWPERSLAVTFDDGYLNNVTIAAPILLRMGIPATFFVTSGFVEQRLVPWWYGLRARLAGRSDGAAAALLLEARLRSLRTASREQEIARLAAAGVIDAEPEDAGRLYPFMSVDDGRRLLAQGFDVQAHGATHASFSGESAEVVREEILASAAFIRRLDHEPLLLAYPYGDEPTDGVSARHAMQSCGMMAAVTTREGWNDATADRWSLNRWDLSGGYGTRAALARVS